MLNTIQNQKKSTSWVFVRYLLLKTRTEDTATRKRAACVAGIQRALKEGRKGEKRPASKKECISKISIVRKISFMQQSGEFMVNSN